VIDGFVDVSCAVRRAAAPEVAALSIIQEGACMCPLDIDCDAFCAWLCLHEHERVGCPGRCFDSPLAQWLQSLTGHMYGIDSGMYGRACWDFRSCLPLPRWAAFFAECVEARSGFSMTGAEAFALLAHVEVALVPRRDRHCAA
jgi:hypothetical protein